MGEQDRIIQGYRETFLAKLTWLENNYLDLSKHLEADSIKAIKDKIEGFKSEKNKLKSQINSYTDYKNKLVELGKLLPIDIIPYELLPKFEQDQIDNIYSSLYYPLEKKALPRGRYHPIGFPREGAQRGSLSKEQLTI